MRRALAPVLAGVLVLGGCATQSPDAQLVDAFDALVAQANARDAAGVASAADAFINLVHRQEGDDLTAAQARSLTDLAAKVKANAGLLEQQDAPSPTPTPARTQAPPPTPDDDEDEGEGEEDKGKETAGGSASSSPPPATSEPEPEPTAEPTTEITIGTQPSPEEPAPSTTG